MRVERSLCGFDHIRGNGEIVMHANLGNFYGLIDFFDVSFDGGGEVVRESDNLARCQRAGKSAGQSSRDGGDHVIEGRRDLFLGLDTVERCDAAMNAVGDGVLKVFDQGPAQWRVVLFNFDVARVDDFSHREFLLPEVDDFFGGPVYKKGARLMPSPSCLMNQLIGYSSPVETFPADGA